MRLPQREQFGLWLNIERELARNSAAVSLGIGAALGGELDKEFFKHFTENEGIAALAAVRRKREST